MIDENPLIIYTPHYSTEKKTSLSKAMNMQTGWLFVALERRKPFN